MTQLITPAQALILPNPNIWRYDPNQPHEREFYRTFFEFYNDLANPTDPNCEEKYDFIMGIGFENTRAMQRLRKNKAWCRNNPHIDFTKLEYWHGPNARARRQPPLPQQYDVQRAYMLYNDYFTRYGADDNPTDINGLNEYNWARQIGWQDTYLMQIARKWNTAVHGYPNPWTQYDGWHAGARP